MSSTETTLQQDLRKLGTTSSIASAMVIGVLSIVFLSSVWLTVSVVHLTAGLKRSNDKIAAQQVVLTKQQSILRVQQTSIAAQQVALKRTQTVDAYNNCLSVNVAYSVARGLVREESVVQVRQAISLLDRSRQAGALNPPKNPQASAARTLSDRFLTDLETDTVKLAFKAIGDVDAKTKPLTCSP